MKEILKWSWFYGQTPEGGCVADVCVWQSAPPRRETNNALKREPLELELR